jgi:hypothetical protein
MSTTFEVDNNWEVSISILANLYNLNYNLLVWWIIVYFKHLYEDVFSNNVYVLLLFEQTMPSKEMTLLEKVKLKTNT